MRSPESYDIFCRVVDNFGDAGFCWRLARVLALEQRARVRLWIDDTATLARLVPAASNERIVDGVEIARWAEVDSADVWPSSLADVVVEAFGCGLPDAYIAALLRAPLRSVWIVLEHLTAEAWAADHHGLPSPHPKYPLERAFFFPGFTTRTGGLLREADLVDRRERFDDRSRSGFWNSVGHSVPPPDATVVSLFAYEHAPLAEWLDCWTRGPGKVVVAIPEGRLLDAAFSHFHAAVGERVLVRGALELRALPFLTQIRYDELLWSCDINFVRGEDSFVRAQWAARPFIWHAYRQEQNAHHQKLDAFTALYSEGLDAAAGSAVALAMRTWNGALPSSPCPAAWQALMQQRRVLENHARRWAERLAVHEELGSNLAQFCADRLK